MREIEMNKRPSGTRVIDKEEKEAYIKELLEAKKELQNGIEHMSVTLFTPRAQNQMNGYLEKMEEVDRALTVFGREKAYIAENHDYKVVPDE